ncbi:MAG: alpha/beta-type small acid-soluble spore protein [Bacillota bacterium]|nr:alpha/beta-type small acid-soluble spore protein [Bacillota bacterium]
MSSYNKTLIPEAKQGLNQLKVETAREVGIGDYDSQDKGNLSSRQNGTVGGNMVKKMIADYESKIK